MNRNSTATIMDLLERRVEKLEAKSGASLPKHVFKITTLQGGSVDTTGWKEVLRSETDNGKGMILECYELVPPDEKGTKERQ